MIRSNAFTVGFALLIFVNPLFFSPAAVAECKCHCGSPGSAAKTGYTPQKNSDGTDYCYNSTPQPAPQPSPTDGSSDSNWSTNSDGSGLLATGSTASACGTKCDCFETGGGWICSGILFYSCHRRL